MLVWKKCSDLRFGNWPAGEPPGPSKRCWHTTRRKATLRPVRDPGGRGRGRRGREAGLRPVRWASSSDRPSWSSTSASCSRRRGNAISRSITCSLLGHRVWARRRWPGSWPPRWGRAFGSTSGPALTRAGDRPAAHRPPRRRRALHRRDPSPAPLGRRDARFGHGGRKARHLDRQGTHSAFDRLDLPKFTLVGATTCTGLVSGPLRDPASDSSGGS